MYPEDRVLVAVINRVRDLKIARDDGWYRVPLARMERATRTPHGVDVEYVAFFLSRAFGEQNGAVHFYARCVGLELAYRRDLLPDEPHHLRADDVYYRVALSALMPLVKPIPNTENRRVAFIHTTWAQFVNARSVAGLYMRQRHYVARIHEAKTPIQRLYDTRWRGDEF